jgi:hypothetical protein
MAESEAEIKRTIWANKIVAYLILALLAFVSFGFGGSSAMDVYLMLAFILTLAIFTFSEGPFDKDGFKNLVIFAIPVLFVAIFGSFSRFWLPEGQNLISSDIITMFGVGSFLVMGYAARINKNIKTSYIMASILGGLALLVLVSTFYGLIRYGFFYITKYANMVYFYEGEYFTVSSEMKLVVGFKFLEVSLKYGSIYALILAASLLVLLFLDPKKNKILFYVILSEGAVGLLSLLALGNFKVMLYLLPAVGLALLLKFLKLRKETSLAGKIVGWSILGLFSVLLLVVFINAGSGSNMFASNRVLNKLFNNGVLLQPINEIIEMVFNNGSSGTHDIMGIFFGSSLSDKSYWNGITGVLSLSEINNKAFEFVMLYEGGILAFLGLCVFFLFVIWSYRKWIRDAEGVTAYKAFVGIFLLTFLFYMSFSTDIGPYIHVKEYISPFRRNGLFYVALFLAGNSFTPFWRVKAGKTPQEVAPVKSSNRESLSNAGKDGKSDVIDL